MKMIPRTIKVCLNVTRSQISVTSAEPPLPPSWMQLPSYLQPCTDYYILNGGRFLGGDM